MIYLLHDAHLLDCVFFLFFSAKQHFLAVTDDQGTIRVLEIPKTLQVPSRGEVRWSIHLKNRIINCVVTEYFAK